MKKQHEFGFLCKRPTKKQLEKIILGEKFNLTLLEPLPSCIGNTQTPTQDDEFKEIIKGVVGLLKLNPRLRLNNKLIPKKIKKLTDLSKKGKGRREIWSICGHIHICYKEVFSCMGRNVVSTNKKELYFILSFDAFKDKAYLFLNPLP